MKDKILYGLLMVGILVVWLWGMSVVSWRVF